MYVGHALVGFALGATLARRWGLSRDRALTLGVVAAGFAVVPDVDGVYTLSVVLGSAIERGSLDLFPTTKYVWPHSWVVHRSITHSLVTGSAAVALAWGVASTRGHGGDGWRRSVGGPVALGAALAVVGVAGLADGPTAAGVATAFVLVTAFVALLARHHLLTPRQVALAAASGLLSHPFGDVFMGRPPQLFYPLDWPRLVEPIVLSPEPTVRLLALFALELAAAWWALRTYGALRGRSLRVAFSPVAAVGASYVVVAPFVAPPTLDLAYQWTAGLLGVGCAVGLAPVVDRGWTAVDPFEVVATALGALTYALLGYLVGYVWLA